MFEKTGKHFLDGFNWSHQYDLSTAPFSSVSSRAWLQKESFIYLFFIHIREASIYWLLPRNELKLPQNKQYVTCVLTQMKSTTYMYCKSISPCFTNLSFTNLVHVLPIQPSILYTVCPTYLRDNWCVFSIKCPSASGHITPVIIVVCPRMYGPVHRTLAAISNTTPARFSGDKRGYQQWPSIPEESK